MMNIKWPEEKEWPADMGQEMTKEEAMGWNACLRKCKAAYESAKKDETGLLIYVWLFPYKFVKYYGVCVDGDICLGDLHGIIDQIQAEFINTQQRG